MLGIGQRCYCEVWFEKLNIFPVLCLYIFLSIFVFNNLDNLRTNSLLRDFNTNSKNQLHFLSVKLTSVEKGVTYFAIKILISYPQTYWNSKKIKCFVCQH